MDVVIITGLSGAGKSHAANCLEDMGYYCIDNMPPALIKAFMSLEEQNKIAIEKAAFVIDIRGGEFFDELNQALDDLRTQGKECTVLFLEASDSALVTRFKETRRNHPLNHGGTNSDAIKAEREKLKDIRKKADYIIDTSNMKAAALSATLKKLLLSEKQRDTFRITVQSFGFKNGMSLDADIVFDCRFLPNPFYLASMKKLTGNSRKVRDYVMKFPEANLFLDKVDEMMKLMIPSFMREGKYSLVVAFGCTGGQHRSVVMANEFTSRMLAEGRNAACNHRDLSRK